MSKYTTEVRYICEHYAGLDESKGFGNVADIIAEARSKVFDFEFPIYDESYRSVLETKILKHYYTREIGAESVGLWKLWLDTRLNEIMPYYNDLYRSALLEFNPLIDTDFTSQHNGESAGESKNGLQGSDVDSRNYQTTDSGRLVSEGSSENLGSRNNTGTDDNWNYYSDTPQGGINGLSDNTYLTNATHNTDSNTNSETSRNDITTDQTTTNNNTRTEGGSGTKNRTENRTGEFSNTDSYIDHVVGKRGTASYSSLIMEFRKTLINIDMMIIDELGDLFMNVW